MQILVDIIYIEISNKRIVTKFLDLEEISAYGFCTIRFFVQIFRLKGTVQIIRFDSYLIKPRKNTR